MSFIKKIRIKNFKNLEDVEIDVKPLTFLFGPNGSGKSSLMKAMMFLQKNLFPLNTGKTIYKISDDVDLGSYKDIVTRNDLNKNIIFEFDLIDEYVFPKIDCIKNGVVDENILNDSNRLRNKNFLLEMFEYRKLIDEADYKYNEFLNNFEYLDFNFTYIIEFKNSNIDYNLYRVILIDNLNNSKYEFVGNSENNEERIGKEDFNFFNNSELSELFNKNMHLKTDYYVSVKNKKNTFGNLEMFRQKFKLNKLYSIEEVLEGEFNTESKFRDSYFSKEWSDLNNNEKIKFYFEVLKFCYLSINYLPYYFEVFLLFKHIPLIRYPPKQKYLLDRSDFNDNDYYGFLKFLDKKTEYNEIDLYIQKLGFGDHIEITKNEEIGSICIFDKFNNKTNISDMSSGFIQLFPVLILLNNLNIVPYFYDLQRESNYGFNYDFHYYESPTGGNGYFTMFIEQPELHLHPKLQSMLAELFSDTIRNYDNNLFIETHSEHLIRKIQVLIANGNLEAERVGVWYFDNSEGTTKIKQMEIDENGLFKEDWPKGFFDDSVNLTMELFEAIRKRKN